MELLVTRALRLAVVAGLLLATAACAPAEESGPGAAPLNGHDAGDLGADQAPADATEPASSPAPQTEEPPPATASSEPAPTPPPADLSPPDLTDWSRTGTTTGALTVAWRPVDGDAIPRNRETSLEVVVLQDGVPREGLRLQVSGFMPAHDHGLVQIPTVEDQGQGRYRVDGLLLHMRGHWQLRFALSARGLMEAATFELDL